LRIPVHRVWRKKVLPNPSVQRRGIKGIDLLGRASRARFDDRDKEN